MYDKIQCEVQECREPLNFFWGTKDCTTCGVTAGDCCYIYWATCENCEATICEKCEDSHGSLKTMNTDYCDSCVKEYGLCEACGYLILDDYFATKYSCPSRCCVCQKQICANWTCRKPPHEACPCGWEFCFLCHDCTHVSEKCSGVCLPFEKCNTEHIELSPEKKIKLEK